MLGDRGPFDGASMGRKVAGSLNLQGMNGWTAPDWQDVKKRGRYMGRGEKV